MGDIVFQVTRALQVELGSDTKVLQHQRWSDPAPGRSVVVIRSQSDWGSSQLYGAQLPVIQALIYSAPNAGQDDAQTIGRMTADDVRRVLHRPTGEPLGDLIHCRVVGRSVGEPEGHPDWSITILNAEGMTQ